MKTPGCMIGTLGDSLVGLLMYTDGDLDPYIALSMSGCPLDLYKLGSGWFLVPYIPSLCCLE